MLILIGATAALVLHRTRPRNPASAPVGGPFALADTADHR